MAQAFGPVWFVVFALGILCIVVCIAMASQALRKARELRQAELFRLSHDLGLEFWPHGFAEPKRGLWEMLAADFQPSQAQTFLQRFDGFYPFGTGQNPQVQNLIFGRREGLDWTFFDYIYETTSTDGKGNRSTHRHPFSVVAVRVPLVLPGIKLSPETVMHRIGQMLGGQELTFELEAFNRRYFVQANDRKLAYDLLHPQAIDYLMAKPVRLWQMGGMFLVVATPGQYDPQDFYNVFDEMSGFLNLVPEYVRQDRGFVPRFAGALDG